MSSIKKEKIFSLLKLKEPLIYSILNNKQYGNRNNYKNRLLNTINYYITNQNTHDEIFKILLDIIKYYEKYSVRYHNICELCNIERVHSISYDPQKSILKNNTYLSNSIQNEPYILMCPGNAINHDIYYICQHFMLEVDTCLTENPSFSIIFDFKNYTFGQMMLDMNIAIELSNILYKCYYNRLTSIYLVEPPNFLSPMISIMKTLFSNSIYIKMQSITREKIKKIILE